MPEHRSTPHRRHVTSGSTEKRGKRGAASGGTTQVLGHTKGCSGPLLLEGRKPRSEWALVWTTGPGVCSALEDSSHGLEASGVISSTVGCGRWCEEEAERSQASYLLW